MAEPPVFTPAYELFFVLEPVRSSFHDMVRSLTPLSDSEAPTILGVDVYYRKNTDVALLAVRFDERKLNKDRLTWVLDLAKGAGMPVLDPVRLSDDDRRAFYGSYLEGYEVRLEDFAGVQSALFELGRRLDLLVRSATAATPLPAPPPGTSRLGSPGLLEVAPAPEPLRPATASSPMPPQLGAGRGAMGKLAPGQRRPSERQQLPLAEQAALVRQRARSSTRAPTAPYAPYESSRNSPDSGPITDVEPLGTAGRAPAIGAMVPTPARVSAMAAPTSSRGTTTPPGVNDGTPTPLRADLLADGRPEPRVDVRGGRNGAALAALAAPGGVPVAESYDRSTRIVRNGGRKEGSVATTPPRWREVPGDPGDPGDLEDLGPDEVEVVIEDTPLPSSRRVARTAEIFGPEATGSTTTSSSSIDVRFLRGGQWMPARLRSLSLKGAYLVTGAPPRIGDSVHIALGFEDLGALVRGTVHHVTTAEDARTTGSSGFAVRFPSYATPARGQLIDLLRRARTAGVTIKPPPPRRAVRFPVHWPVRFGSRGDSFRADALDISLDGMFIATGRMIGEEELGFRLPLDVDQAAISGRARVVRALKSDAAQPRGLRSGYGMRIVEMSDADQQRYGEFLDRVRRRTEKRVVVGAAAGRIDEMVDALTSVGYMVMAGSDPGVLVRLADFDPRPPDAAVIDSSLATQGLRASWLEQLFGSRKVPCLGTDGEAPDRTRGAVDRLLQIAAA